MILVIYSVYDSKVGAYLQPFFMRSRGEASRAFTEAVADSNSPFCKHPDDFVLFELGTFDDSTGLFDMFSAPCSLGTALQFRVASNDIKHLEGVN